MLTKLTIRNFKRFEDVEIPLSSPVVLVGPNNSGKTSALQALALWELGLRRWKEKRGGSDAPSKRPGVAINRRDLLMVPVPAANLLWRGLHVRNVQRADGKQQTQNVRMEIIVTGHSADGSWECGLEFDFANDESIFCRPLRTQDLSGSSIERMAIPDEAYTVQVAFLPPMSGLASNETRLDAGALNVRLGEGRTAEVLRNLCHGVAADEKQWNALTARIKDLFGVTLETPRYIVERGEIEMTYLDENNTHLDLSSSGRGLQQTLLLLAFMSSRAGSVLLLDEPDAHLEILRQREIFQILTESARESGSQLIIASHSEEVLNQAAGANPDSIVAFLGKPHRIPPARRKTLQKSLDTFRWDQYLLAEQTGWVLYVEGTTDLSILQAFAKRLNHRAADKLRSPFLFPTGNQPNRAREHFNALAEAKAKLLGFLLVDSDAGELQARPELREWKWQRHEIENYLCQPETLYSFAEEYGRTLAVGPLFGQMAVDAMREAVEDRITPAALRDRSDPWWISVKASDDFLDLVFAAFAKKLNLPLDVRKADYHLLVAHIPESEISDEIREVLNVIADVAEAASPACNEPS